MEPRRRSLFGVPNKDGDDRWMSPREVNELARQAVESALPWVRVTGELSNVVHASSGHVYFTVKDAAAQLACVLWRASAARLPFRLADGQEARLQGTLSIYAPRGQFQMIVERAELAGRGSLEARLRELRKKYEELGYFARERKRPLPFLPDRIGLVTSPVGAAIHDVLRTVFDRLPGASVIVSPVRVQGPEAAAEIAQAIDRQNELGLADVLIVGRGGGSLEDLWAFNEPPVIEAIFRSAIPVVSAVGHEIDVTLADLVADVRALTPTDAGEKVVPRRDDLLEILAKEGRALRGAVRTELEGAKRRLADLGASEALREPRRVLERTAQRVDDLARSLATGLERAVHRRRETLSRCAATLAIRNPNGAIERERARLAAASQALAQLLRDRTLKLDARLEGAAKELRALSPRRVLERGYSIAVEPRSGRVLRDVSGLAPGDPVAVHLASGSFDATVLRTQRGDESLAASGDEPPEI